MKETDEARIQEHYKQWADKVKAQHQGDEPGRRDKMTPKADCGEQSYEGSGRLNGQVALITGGDSGIGRAVAIAFAREGADVAILYKEEGDDAKDTAEWVKKAGRRCLAIAGDLGDDAHARDCVERTIKEFGRLDILVNNAGIQRPEKLEELQREEVEDVFRSNVFSHFSVLSAAIKHLKKGARIINTTSITAFRGQDLLLSYSTTKGAMLALTRTLNLLLLKKGIRCNAVAPGPIWTPLIPASFPEGKVGEFGEDSPMGRPGQPAELAGAFVYLASTDSSYTAGQVIHVNGGSPF